jgi:hypothetical protein
MEEPTERLPEENSEIMNHITDTIAQNAKDILIIDPQQIQDYKEMVKDTTHNLVVVVDAPDSEKLSEKLKNESLKRKTSPIIILSALVASLKEPATNVVPNIPDEELEKLNKIFEQKHTKTLYTNPTIDDTPRYDKFLKK